MAPVFVVYRPSSIVYRPKHMARLRVLYLVPDLFGQTSGISRYCRMVCKALVESGAMVTVVSLADMPSMHDQVSGDFPGVVYRACGGSRRRFAWSALSGAMKRRPDVVLVGHANFSPLGWLIAKLVRARSLGFIYGIEVWKPLKPVRRWALLKLDAIISISRFTARRAAAANGLSARKVRILPNCLDPHLSYEGQAGEASQERPPSMLTVARMSLTERYKGHDYVIRAMPALLERHPRLVYDIIGDGDARPSLEAVAAQMGVSRAVRFHGVVPDEELRRRYAEASLFIMPSRGEGFGFVFLEAMAQGTPAIGGNVDATPEVITHGLTGYLVDPTSVEAIVEASDRLLRDQELRREMSQAARRHVEEKFGYPRFRQRLISYLQVQGSRFKVQGWERRL